MRCSRQAVARSASPALNVLRSLAQDGLGRTISGSASASRPAVTRSAPSAMNVLHAPSSEPPDRTDQSFCSAKRCGAVGWTTTEIGHSSAHARVREDDARVQRLLTDPVPGSMTPRRRPATRSNAQAGSTSACGRYGSITMCGGWAEASRICARAARRDHVHVELANRGDGDAENRVVLVEHRAQGDVHSAPARTSGGNVVGHERSALVPDPGSTASRRHST